MAASVDQSASASGLLASSVSFSEVLEALFSPAAQFTPLAQARSFEPCMLQFPVKVFNRKIAGQIRLYIR